MTGPVDPAKSPTAGTQPLQRKPAVMVRLARFLGLRKVAVAASPRQLPNKNHPATPMVPLSKRSISAHSQRYLGFRSTRKNLAHLELELLSSPLLQEPGRSGANKLARVRLAMVAAGMARLQGRDPVTIAATDRPFWKSQLTVKQFQKLEEFLKQSDVELLNHFNPEVALTFPLRIPNPSELAQAAGVDELSSPVSRIIRFRECRHYCLHGEGLEQFRKLGCAWLNNLPRLLPDLQHLQSFDDEEVVLLFDALRRKSGSPRGTGLTALEQARSRFRIDFREGVAVQSFSPGYSAHRSLVIIEELASLYIAMFTKAQLSADSAEDKAGLDNVSRQRMQVDNTLHGLAHRVMKKQWPRVFGDHHYRQLLLRDAEDPTVTRWNSDSFQPRGGWFDLGAYHPL